MLLRIEADGTEIISRFVGREFAATRALTRLAAFQAMHLFPEVIDFATLMTSSVFSPSNASLGVVKPHFAFVELRATLCS